MGNRDLARRRLIQGSLALAGLGLLAGCDLEVPALRRRRVARVGFLATGSPPPGVQHRAFLQGLRDLGYVEGRNVDIEYRWGDEQQERLPGLAAELVGLNVDVILAAGGDAALAAREATSTIPIVFGAAADPVGLGLVSSLPRPGGNVTGLSAIAPALAPKRVELLRETVPDARRLAVLADAKGVNVERDWDESQAAARVLGREPRRYDVESPEDFEGAFAAMAAEGAGALVVLQSPFFVRSRARVVAAAAKARLPAVYDNRLFTDAGGLMSYGPDVTDLYRRAADYVDKILKGTKPADLPVELPAKLDAVVNLKTAQALGLTIPPSVLQQATEVIQ